jgi:alpha-tubulin suppressor-like RCC1 family protein
VPAGNDYAAAACGYGHSLALKLDGTVIGWGSNTYGQINVPSGTYSAIAAGRFHSLGLRTDGSLVSWGSDVNGLVSNTPAGNNFVAVAASTAGFGSRTGFNSMALRSDGSVVCWGKNDFGQISNIPIENDFIAIAVGPSHCEALRSNGTIACWGSLSTPPEGSNYIKIAAGDGFGIAIKSDGSAVTWGSATAAPAGYSYLGVAGGSYGSCTALQSYCPYALVGDLNGNCKVGYDDLFIMFENWLKSDATADIAPVPGDGIVNFRDYTALAENWLIDCQQTPLNPACVAK